MKRLFFRLSKALILGFFLAGALLGFQASLFQFSVSETNVNTSAGVLLAGVAFVLTFLTVVEFMIQKAINNKLLGQIINIVTTIASMGCAGLVIAFVFAPLTTNNVHPDFNFWHFIKWPFIYCLLALVPAAFVYGMEYIREMPWYRKGMIIGKPSARLGSLYSFRKQALKIDLSKQARSKTDKLLLGRTLFLDDPLERRTIGVSPDSHLTTIGMTGSGKAATSAWHNLAMYQGSMIVFDPKGEHSRMAFRRRQNWRYMPSWAWIKDIKHSIKTPASCTMLDPYNVNENEAIPSSRYNPLSDIDLSNESEALSLMYSIADGCIIPDGDKAHFSDHARGFIVALIGHVMTAYPKENHNLPFVHDLFYGLEEIESEDNEDEAFKNLLLDMGTNHALGGKIIAKAKTLFEMGDNELGSVLSTIDRGLGWIADPMMREQLSASDFSLTDFGIKRVEAFKWRRILWKEEKVSLGYRDKIETLFIVLPFERMQEEPRWMRVLSSLSIRLLISQGLTKKRPEIPTTVLLDEFAQLGGRVDSVVNAFNIARGAGLKLWIMLQNLKQIQDQYDNWNDIISGSTIQLFGVNDLNTARYFSELCGRMVRKETTRKGLFGRKKTSEHVNDMFSPDAIMENFDKASNEQLVLRPSGRPLRLERVGFQSYKDRDGNRFHGIEVTTKAKHMYDGD